MSRDLFSKYIWIIDTIKRHGRISRRELDSLWRRSSYSQGEGLPRRTFYNYRTAIEQLFGITIMCDPVTFEYYIGDQSIAGGGNVTDWMLNSAAINNSLADASAIADRIFVEDVPSAREHLASVITALKEYHPIVFTYHPYTRSTPNTGVVIEPYFLKIFRQRWYVTGRNTRQNVIKTYALDRMSNLSVQSEVFEMPVDFSPAVYARDSFGIIFNQGNTYQVSLKCDPRRAKYLRALPLHHSQNEMVGDGYSVFTYRLKLTPDLVQELVSLGPSVTVLSPPELKAMVVKELTATLANYNQ